MNFLWNTFRTGVHFLCATVFAVPGQADNPQAKGTNSLIRDGAIITESFDDILNEFEFLPGLKPSMPKGNAAPCDLPAGTLTFSEDEQAVLDILKIERRMSADQITSSTGINPGRLLAALMQLEMKKIIVQLPGKHFEIK